FKGAANLDELHRRLRCGVMIRRLKADVLHQLPPKFRRVLPVELSNRDEYEQANSNFATWLKENYRGKATRSLRAAAVTKIGYLLRLTGRLKCKAVVRWANRFLRETDEKLILYAVHRKMIAALARRVRAKHVIVDGSVTGRMRKAAVDQFQGDANTRLLIGNLQAGGVGLTLTASSTVGFAELYWRPADHVQAEDRIHRIGQENDCWINYLVAGGTIEETLCRVIQEKQQVLNSVLDGRPVEDLDVWDQLIKETLK
ncbi:MAG: helicase-related protein, partial [Planctomycetota bacterium]